MSKVIADFVCIVNMVKVILHIYPRCNVLVIQAILYALYGCPLRDLSHKSMNKFYISWRKGVILVLGLPLKTHCKLNEQLSIRFVKFTQSLHNSDNHLSRMCAVSCKLFNVNRDAICSIKIVICTKPDLLGVIPQVLY